MQNVKVTKKDKKLTGTKTYVPFKVELRIDIVLHKEHNLIEHRLLQQHLVPSRHGSPIVPVSKDFNLITF